MAHFNDEAAYDALAPGVDEAIARMPAALFSTKAVIEQLRSAEAGAAAYEQALQVLAEIATEQRRGDLQGSVARSGDGHG